MQDVLNYAEPIRKKGFNFMDSPGFDPVSVTGQVAAGSNVICFTDNFWSNGTIFSLPGGFLSELQAFKFS